VGIALTKIDDRIHKHFGRRRHRAAIEHANAEHHWVLRQLTPCSIGAGVWLVPAAEADKSIMVASGTKARQPK
jgi:hypothetical protein